MVDRGLRASEQDSVDSDRYLGYLLRLPVRTNMKETPPTLSPADSVSAAIDAMMKENVGAIVVVEDNTPLGIVTEKDLLDRVINSKKDFELTSVKEIMSKPLISIESSQSVSDALKIMSEHDIRRLVITENGVLVGLTTERRLLEVAYGQYISRGYDDVRSGLYNEANKVGVAYVSTYPPRECGIATYTEDLVAAVSRLRILQPPFVVAINDRGGHYDYGVDVRFQIDREEIDSYTKAADHINRSNINIVNVQHEYGIFGGHWGEDVITFLEALEKPVVTTLHTVLEEPTQDAREVLRATLERSDFVVVMAKVGIRILENHYEYFADKIRCIPHGCPNVPHVRPETFKQSLGLEGRTVLTTFGLLSSGKGIEYAIEALPEVVKKDPRVLYLIIGATHPEVRKREGETYREKLLNLVDSLGLWKNVKFVNRFLPRNELIRYLQATDIYVIPYPNREQISSGTLLYALSTGKAIIATPFLQAEEVMHEGHIMGCEFKKPSSITECIMTLLENVEYRERLERGAYQYTREKIWPNVAMEYVNLFYYTLGL